MKDNLLLINTLTMAVVVWIELRINRITKNREHFSIDPRNQWYDCPSLCSRSTRGPTTAKSCSSRIVDVSQPDRRNILLKNSNPPILKMYNPAPVRWSVCGQSPDTLISLMLIIRIFWVALTANGPPDRLLPELSSGRSGLTKHIKLSELVGDVGLIVIN